MNFKLELPRGTILLNRSDLKVVLEELLGEIQDQEAEDEIMTIKEAAEYLKVSVPTIRNMIAAREIPFFQRGQIIRLNRLDLKEWLRNNPKR